MNRITLDRAELRRDLGQLAPCLLIGAVINFAVACSCALWAEIPSSATKDRRAQKSAMLAFWLERKPDGFPEHDWSAWIYNRGFGVQSSMMLSMPDTEYPTLPKPSEVFDLNLVEAGWPLASFKGGIWSDGGTLWGGAGIRETHWALDVDPIDVPIPFVEWSRIIPLQPKWSGVVVNTVFFGGIVFLLFRWPPALRRYRRLARGLCPSCAYDVKHVEHVACPECGAAAAA